MRLMRITETWMKLGEPGAEPGDWTTGTSDQAVVEQAFRRTLGAADDLDRWPTLRADLGADATDWLEKHREEAAGLSAGEPVKLRRAEVLEWLATRGHPAQWAFTDELAPAQAWEREEESRVLDRLETARVIRESLTPAPYRVRQEIGGDLWIVEGRIRHLGGERESVDDLVMTRVVLVTSDRVLAQDVSARLNLAAADGVRRIEGDDSIPAMREPEPVEEAIAEHATIRNRSEPGTYADLRVRQSIVFRGGDERLVMGLSSEERSWTAAASTGGGRMQHAAERARDRRAALRWAGPSTDDTPRGPTPGPGDGRGRSR